MRRRFAVKAVLFDLDGTLVDSAPDLAGAANQMRAHRQLPALPLEHYRPHGGSGARGMLKVAFDMDATHADYAAHREEFLALYSTRLLHQTRCFAAVPPMLAALHAAGLPWGVVTNKALALAEPIVTALLPQSKVVVGGDSTPHTKPHPAPLLLAANQLGLVPSACLYVGDDPRDVQAGRSAGMATLAAAWGYLGVHSAPGDWGADAVLAQPESLLQWLELA